MKALTKIIAVLALVAVVVCGALALLNQAAPTAVNAALDASGVKTQAEDALRSHVADIAAATGLSEDQVSAAIDSLDIDSWAVTSLPANVRETGSVDVAYQGVDATVTTYDDPSYVTVDALGQNITLEVPASAQQYLSLLGYLS